MFRRLLPSVVCVLLCASVADAQTDRTRWGAGVSYAPTWKVPTGDGPFATLAEQVFEASDLGLDVKGKDFRIGVVRGRSLSGEWGVSYVHRNMKDGSSQGGVDQQCFESGFPGQASQCYTYGDLYLYRSVTLRGVEMNKFMPMVLIKDRVQIGLDVAGGFGAMKGTAEHQETDTSFQDIKNAQGFVTSQKQVVTTTSTIVDARELMTLDPTLIGRAEVAVAGILTSNLKVRFSAGFNFPGTHTVSIGMSYFLGPN